MTEKSQIPGDGARIHHQIPELQLKGYPADFVPLHLEIRSHVTTPVMCRHLNRKEQTARAWACLETYPEGLRPIRINGRLHWPVAGIRRVLGVA